MTQEDTYKTLAAPAEGTYTEKRSKFLAFAMPVRTVDEVKQFVDAYQKKYYDARHLCYAYMLGAERKDFRGQRQRGTVGYGRKNPFWVRLIAMNSRMC